MGYNSSIMKHASRQKTRPPSVKKLRNKLTNDIYYRNVEWPSKSIDGIEFLAVSLFDPQKTPNKNLLYIRKDSVESI